MSVNIHAYEENGELVYELADRIAQQLATSIDYRGSASLAISGGNTPKTLFQALSRCELPWEYVWITLVDERWVSEEHADSNACLAKENLLQNNAAKAHFISLKSEHSSPFDGEEVIAERLRQLAMPFDVVILGMGNDGHTASFFPGAETLTEALQPSSGKVCVGVRPVTAPHDRMTLTLPTLLNSKLIVLHLVGESKWQVLHQAMEVQDQRTLPVSTVLQQTGTPVEVYYAAHAEGVVK